MKCPTCGCSVRVEGRTTHYYVSDVAKRLEEAKDLLLSSRAIAYDTLAYCDSNNKADKYVIDKSQDLIEKIGEYFKGDG